METQKRVIQKLATPKKVPKTTTKKGAKVTAKMTATPHRSSADSDTQGASSENRGGGASEDRVVSSSEAAAGNPKKRQVRRQKQDSPAEDLRGVFCGHEWQKLTPKGVVFEGHHFVLILEDAEQKIQLPLRFPLQSGDMLTVPNAGSVWKKSLATLQERFFPSLGIEFRRCVFVPVKSESHRVKLYYRKQGVEFFFESDLDRVLGLCLEAKLPFYATSSYIQQAKINSGDSEIFLQNQRWTDGRQKYLM